MRLLTFFLIYLALPALANCQVDLLAQGALYKIDIAQDGIYKLTGQWLQDNINETSLSTDNINILGVPSGPLAHDSNWAETERLQPISIMINDGGDGVIDNNDYILFYGQGPDAWCMENQWEHLKNPFANLNSYILKINDGQAPVRIEQEEPTNPSAPTDEYIFASIYHEDISNLLGADLSTQGSGQRWFGRELTNVGEVDFSSNLLIPNGGLTDVQFSGAFAGRSKTSENFKLLVGSELIDVSFSPVNTGDIEELYARISEPSINLSQLSSTSPIAVDYDKSDAEAKLWLDWLKVTGRTSLTYSHSALLFNNLVSIQNETNALRITNGNNIQVWDISNPLSPIRKSTSIENNNALISTSNVPSQFFAFDVELDFVVPKSVKPIPNTVLDTDLESEMIVIYPSILENSARTFIQHRSNHSKISVAGIAVDDIYNTYAAGRPDVTALRNYIRDIYRSNGTLKFVLLFGDGSYDYRGLSPDLSFDNLVPTFETFESLDPLFAFPSDDYFGLLDDGENGSLIGDLDVAVGRITVSNSIEADAVVNKIINYDTNEASKGPWKANIAFLADDEDRNLHVNDADIIAKEVGSSYPLFNQEKIYFDAFTQTSTAGGNRYPEATEKLNNTIENGALVVNYLGHGGPRGWSQERVLKVDDITSWTNSFKLPLVVTATCSFTGFDDPAVSTAGEEVLLNPVGGAIALFTTVRSVFASKNFTLTRSVFRQMFEREQGQYLTIGEIMQRGKNSILNDALNGRKFFLIGDPSLHLAIPSYTVETTDINGNEIHNALVVDTIGALDVSTVKGKILTPLGEIASDFNGKLDITVFDKSSTVNTLANDDLSFVKEFSTQNNFIYKGRIAVTDGQFEFTWRVPVDINYSFGTAKFSYYALADDGREAVGYNLQLAIEGSAENPPTDTQGPNVEVFMNDRSFEDGDIISPNSVAIVDISDESGINISTAGIGHEITAQLNGEVTIVNEFYVPSLDNPNAGMLVIPMDGLEEGFYTLTIKAFDVYNNPGESAVNFEVRNGILSEALSINLSPNPAPTSSDLNLDILTDSRTASVVANIEVYDMRSQLISKQSDLIANTNGRILATVKMNDDAAGTYLVKIKLTDLQGGLIIDEEVKKVVRLK